MYSPLEQFSPFFNWLNLLPLWCWPWIQLLNSTITLLFISLFCIQAILLVIDRPKAIPNGWTILINGVYEFILGLFKRHTTSLHAERFFSFIFTLFVYLFLINAAGLLPYSFTFTSHIFVTLSLSLTCFIGVIILAFKYNKLDYFSFFVPKGVTNIYLRQFLVIIEIISYIIRPFSLAIRLFANMLAGHTLLYILTSFVLFLCSRRWAVLWWIPFFIILLIVLLEYCIAFIQAYVFTTLVAIYINDVYNITH